MEVVSNNSYYMLDRMTGTVHIIMLCVLFSYKPFFKIAILYLVMSRQYSWESGTMAALQ